MLKQTAKHMDTFLVVVVLACVGCYGINARSTTQSSVSNIPVGGILNKVTGMRFKNLDKNNNSFVEKDEFRNPVAATDIDNNGCITLEEYITSSVAGRAIAARIYNHFNPTHSECLTVDKVASQFTIMDTNKNGIVTMEEFRQYYTNLFKLILT